MVSYWVSGKTHPACCHLWWLSKVAAYEPVASCPPSSSSLCTSLYLTFPSVSLHKLPPACIWKAVCLQCFPSTPRTKLVVQKPSLPKVTIVFHPLDSLRGLLMSNISLIGAGGVIQLVESLSNIPGALDLFSRTSGSQKRWHTSIIPTLRG